MGWDKLMEDFKDHAAVLIADVDCTAEGKPLCEEVGVEGFPTIKFGDPSALEDYEGGRDYDDMKEFADKNLGPRCGPKNMDLCDDEKKAQIEKLKAMPMDELKAKIEEKQGEMEAAEKELEEMLKGLQEEYEAGQKKSEETKERIKNGGLAAMKKVLKSRSSEKTEL